MAVRFHFNPNTGRTGKCNADPSNPRSTGCLYGQTDEQHGDSREEAQRNYERTMSSKLFSSVDSDKPAERVLRLRSTEALKLSAVPDGMDRIDEISATSLRSYEVEPNPKYRKDIFIGGKYRVTGRSTTESRGKSKLWVIPVEGPDGNEGSIELPMRQQIPVAYRYTPEAKEYNKIREAEEDRLRAKHQADLEAKAKRQANRAEQLKRIETTPYEELSVEDRAAADRLKEQEENRRWDKHPVLLKYEGPNSYRQGRVQGESNSILERIRGVPDYDLIDFNNRISSISESGLPRDEQESLIREERVNYIQTMNRLMDQRQERAEQLRAHRRGFKDVLRSLLKQDERDAAEQKKAVDAVQRDRQALLEFAEKLFAAPPYTQVRFNIPNRRY